MTGTYHLPPRPPVRPFWKTGGGVTLIVISAVIVVMGVGCMCAGIIGAVVSPASTPTRRSTPAAPAVVVTSAASSPSALPSPAPIKSTVPVVPPKTTKPASVYYGSCAAAKAAGAAPLHRGEPGYRSGLDRDGDGTACEK